MNRRKLASYVTLLALSAVGVGMILVEPERVSTARQHTAYFPALVVLGTGVRSLSAVHAKRPFAAASRLTSRPRSGSDVRVRCIVVALLRVAAEGAGGLAIRFQ